MKHVLFLLVVVPALVVGIPIYIVSWVFGMMFRFARNGFIDGKRWEL